MNQDNYEWKGNYARITYQDGTGFTTEINGTQAEVEKYYMQFGGVDVQENQVTGEETRRRIVKVEVFSNAEWKALHPRE